MESRSNLEGGRVAGRVYPGHMTELSVVELGFGPLFVPYVDGWDEQRRVHALVADGVQGDTLLLLEHESVYTAGRRTEPFDRPFDGTPVVDVDRGGKITWHGPGQLTGYPIVRLREPVDVVAFVRDLETMMIAVAADFGVTGERVEGRSGVWVRTAGGWDKIGAIGL